MRGEWWPSRYWTVCVPREVARDRLARSAARRGRSTSSLTAASSPSRSGCRRQRGRCSAAAPRLSATSSGRKDEVCDSLRLSQERVMSGVELDDRLRTVGELSLPLGRGAAVLAADQISGRYLPPGSGSDRLLCDRQALSSQATCRVIDQLGAIMHGGVGKHFRAHAEGAGLDGDV